MKRITVCLTIGFIFSLMIGCSAGISVTNNLNAIQLESQSDNNSMPVDTKISVSDVDFIYKGFYKAEDEIIPMEHFLIENNSDKNVIVSLHIVGVKKDGTHKFLGTGILGGTDQALYDKELKENGWAVPEPTNRIKSGDSLNAYANILSSSVGIDMDVDSDGCYDVLFSIITINKNGGFTITGDEPESKVFQLKVR